MQTKAIDAIIPLPQNVLENKAISVEDAVEIYKQIFPPQTKSTNQTIKNSWEDEEIFALRATDETAPLIIMNWIRENFFTASEMKLRSAFESALRCKEQENKRRAT